MPATRATARAAALAVVLLTVPWRGRAAVPPPNWPDIAAPRTLMVRKASGLELESEPAWLHLHSDTAPSVGVTAACLAPGGDACRGPTIRYTVQGLPVTKWLPWSKRATTLAITHPMLDYLKDGVLDVSIEVQGAARTRAPYKPWPAQLHLKRGRPLGALRAVVIQDGADMDMVEEAQYRSPGVLRLAASERRLPGQDGFNGFPANPQLTRWSVPPYEADLYAESLTPSGGLFQEQYMWWEDLPSHPGLFFVRGLQPKDGEDARSLDNHPRFPASDGARGIGWVSPYIQGLVDPAGRLAFAETSGRVAWLLPTGEIHTLAGWTLAAGRSPVWVRKPLEAVRANQELRGTGGVFRGASGFGRPMDVAFDPADPMTLYVPDLTKHVVWRVRVTGVTNTSDITARPSSVAVDVLAGDATSFASGYADGAGASARFNAPFSATIARGALYVSDSANHAVRRINITSGAVTTVWGGPGFAATLASRGVGDVFDQPSCRAAARVTVTLAEAAGGARPEVYWPGALRATSGGALVLLEHGIGQLRLLDPDTHVARVLANVDQKFSEWDHGWAWLDVDTAGAAGPRDGVYWCKAVGSTVDGDDASHFNEVFAWTPIEGGGSRFVFNSRGGGANPFSWGSRGWVTPPHYPWLVAVDPRGGVLMSGMGSHGVMRVRLREAGDPVVEGDEATWVYYQGRRWFAAGGVSGAGPDAHNLAFRFGSGAHSTLGLRSGDAWQAGGLSDGQLARFYGVPRLGEINNASSTDLQARKECLLAFLRPQSGPTRDGLPAIGGAANDVTPPSAPSGLAAVTRAGEGTVLTWGVASDDVAVLGYTLQVAADAGFTRPVAGHFDVALGNTDAVLLEGLRTRVSYWARLRAYDLAGNAGPWSEAAAFRPVR